ncbi:MAG: hypothetical protein ACI8RA_002979 [Chlamydiales bacterium]
MKYQGFIKILQGRIQQSSRTANEKNTTNTK